MKIKKILKDIAVIMPLFLVMVGCNAVFDNLNAAIIETKNATNFTLEAELSKTMNLSNTEMKSKLIFKLTKNAFYYKMDEGETIHEVYYYSEGINYYETELTNATVTAKTPITKVDYDERFNYYISGLLSFDIDKIGSLEEHDYKIRGSTFEVKENQIASIINTEIKNGKFFIAIRSGKLSIITIDVELIEEGLSRIEEFVYKDYGNTKINFPQNIEPIEQKTFEDFRAALAETSKATNYTIESNGAVHISGSENPTVSLMTVKVTENGLYKKSNVQDVIQDSYCYKEGDKYYLAAMINGVITSKKAITFNQYTEYINENIAVAILSDTNGLEGLTNDDFYITGSTFEVTEEKAASLINRDQEMENCKFAITIDGGKISIIEVSFVFWLGNLEVSAVAIINFIDYGSTEIIIPQYVKDY